MAQFIKENSSIIIIIYNYLMQYDGEELVERFKGVCKDPIYNQSDIDRAWVQVISEKGLLHNQEPKEVSWTFEEEWNE